MTAQVNLLMATIMRSYYSAPKKLWPISLNIEYAYKLSESRIQGRNRSLSITQFFKEYGATGLSICLAGSGPIVLKLLQQYNNNNEEEVDAGITVNQVVENIFSNVPALTQQEMKVVKTKIRGSLSKSRKVLVDNMSERPLGSASIAVAYKTRLANGDRAVLKFVKPFYMFFFLCECDYLLSQVWHDLRQPGVSDVLLYQTRQLLMFLIVLFTEEFDYEQEYWSTVRGYHIYNQPRQNVYSVEVVAPFKMDPLPILVTSAGPERNLKEALEELVSQGDRQGVRQVYNNLINFFKIWFINIFWGVPPNRGFLHADLHAGNILMGPSSAQYCLCIIDYGSSGTLSSQEREHILDAMLLLPGFDTSFLPLITRPPGFCGEFTISGSEYPLSKRPLPGWLNYFQDLRQDQEAKLRPLLGDPRFTRAHRKNKRVVLAFIKKILKVCEVSSLSESELISLRDQVLNYSSSDYNSFGYLFLQIIRYSRDIGQCTNNSTFVFGKGIAYLSAAICAAREACDSLGAGCTPFNLGAIMVSELVKRPSMYPRLVRSVLV